MQHVGLSLGVDDFTAPSCDEFHVTSVDRVHTRGSIDEWAMSASAAMLRHVACRPGSAHQRHAVGFHGTRRPTRCSQTQDSRCRNMLQVCVYVCVRVRVCGCVCVEKDRQRVHYFIFKIFDISRIAQCPPFGPLLVYFSVSLSLFVLGILLPVLSTCYHCCYWIRICTDIFSVFNSLPSIISTRFDETRRCRR